MFLRIHDVDLISIILVSEKRGIFAGQPFSKTLIILVKFTKSSTRVASGLAGQVSLSRGS